MISQRHSYGAPFAAGSATVRNVDELRSRIQRMHDVPTRQQHIPVAQGLESVLPSGLRCGAGYEVDGSAWLLILLLAQASQTRHWCAVVGMPEFGIEAAASVGMDLTRLVLVPSPGQQWLRILSHLSEVMAIVAVRPPGRVSEANAGRIAARLRRYNSVLLTDGAWPRTEAVIRLHSSRWWGLDAGHGRLRTRRMRVEVAGKSGRRQAELELEPTSDLSAMRLVAADERNSGAVHAEHWLDARVGS